jgi:hypothetical protein
VGGQSGVAALTLTVVAVVAEAVRAHLPCGAREVEESEVEDTVGKLLMGTWSSDPSPK